MKKLFEGNDMTLEQVKGIYEELRAEYESSLIEYGVKCESEIYCEDENFEKVDSLGERGYISLDLNVFTDAIDKDNALCFCSSVTVTRGRVDDDEIIEDTKEFERTVREFIDKLSSSLDPDELIKSEIKSTDEEALEIMRKLEKNIKTSSLITAIAVGICVVVAAVALILNFTL